MPIEPRQIAGVEEAAGRELSSRDIGVFEVANTPALTTGGPPGASFSLVTQLAMPLPGVTKCIDTTVRVYEQPMEGAQCCAHAVASAMETRMVKERGLDSEATPIDPRDNFAKGKGKTGMFNAMDVAEAGINTPGGILRGTAQFLGKVTPARMVQELDRNTPLMVEINIGSIPPAAGGIYRLEGSRMSHAVCIIGYGTDPETHEPFWLAKNSFGPSWGEAGFARLLWGDPAVTPERNVYAMRSINP